MSKQEVFISKLIKPAQVCQLKYRVLSSLTISQAILESGWGESELAIQAHNLFGIKGDYNGFSYTKLTKEWDGTNYVTVSANFKKYPNILSSVEDHALFLQKSRYAKVLESTSYKQATEEVWKAGYATAPDYPQKLQRIIEQYSLNHYDNITVCPDCGRPL